MTKPKIFIDGEAGTTGLQILERLHGRTDIELQSISPEKRKEASERQRLLNAADLAILCLPDAAAKEAVAMANNPKTKILDASTAHRTAPNWVYGFAELTKGQDNKIRQARYVSNPGCYATGAISLLRPLTEAGLLPRELPISIFGISGYSGGGRELVERCESDQKNAPAFRHYRLELAHKHLPEIQLYSALEQPPLFVPAYLGHLRQGMLVEIPLHLSTLMQNTQAYDLHKIFAEHYAAQKYVRVMPFNQPESGDAGLSPEALNNSNMLEIYVFTNTQNQAVLMARLDNLGKGASGAAVQNMELMLGLN